MALGALLEASRAEKKCLGGLLEPSWSPDTDRPEVKGRSGGGQGEVNGASLAGHGPWEAPLSKIID